MTTTALQALTATTGNRKDTWNTPIEIVGDVVKFFGTIDLDPCSNSEGDPNVPALNYYTEETNGLAHDWHGKVFMNHPYSNSKEWVPYAALQYESGNAEELVLLIKLDVSTKWWKAVSKYPWVAINKRMKFGDGKGASPFQSAIIYLGTNLEKFNTVFGKYGTLYVPHEEVSHNSPNTLHNALY